jgi:phosphatidylglycerophosphatase A
MLVLALAGSIICVKFAPAAIAATGKKDPGEIVVDEIAGQAITFLPAAFLLTEASSAGQIWSVALAGFLLFRFFDILKPWPVRKLEKLPSGWGVLADDLMAAVFAAIALFVGFKLFATYSAISELN